MKRFTNLICFALMAGLVSTVYAQDRMQQPTQPGQDLAQRGQQQKEELATGLNMPTGIAVQPETGHVFVAESGEKRVIRIVDGEKQEVIIDFPSGTYSIDEDRDIGPLSLKFVDRDTLVVTSGGLDEDTGVIRVFKVPGTDEDPIKAEDSEYSVATGDIDDLDEKSVLWSMTKKNGDIFIAANWNHEKGCIVKVRLNEDGIEEATVFATKRDEDDDEDRNYLPVALTISPDDHLVVSKVKRKDAEDSKSKLVFYNREGEKLAKFETELKHMAALAYDRHENRLFALDVNWDRPDEGGLYILLAGEDADEMRAQRLADFTRPIAMTFDDEGSLLVCVMGDDLDDNNGKVYKIRGFAQTPGIPQRIEEDRRNGWDQQRFDRQPGRDFGG